MRGNAPGSAGGARSFLYLVGRQSVGKWVLVIGMAMAVSLGEAASTVMVFALLDALVGGAEGVELPFGGVFSGLWKGDGNAHVAALTGAVEVTLVLRSVLVLVQNYGQYRVAENAGA